MLPEAILWRKTDVNIRKQVWIADQGIPEDSWNYNQSQFLNASLSASFVSQTIIVC